MLRSFQSKIPFALLGLWAVMGASPVRGVDLIYSVTMDTSSIQGLNGFMTMDFLPSINVQPASVLVSGFNFNGSFLPDVPLTDGAVTGSLNSSVTMGNSTAFNSFSQAMTFGTYLGFTLKISSSVLDNPDPNAQGGTTYAFYLLDRILNTGTPPPVYVPGNSLITTTGLGDAIMNAELCDCGILTVTPYTPLVVIVPEPGTVSLALVGTSILIGLAVARRRRTA